MVKINMRRMEVFKAVFEQGSVSAAARLLNVSQPSVSRTVKDFELDLGFKLFNLDKGKVRATPEAKRLYKESEPVFSHIEHLAKVAQQLQRGEEGLLKVAVAEYLIWDVLPTVALRFADLYPHIRLSIKVQNTEEQLESLARGSLDLAIGSNAVDMDPGITQLTLGQGVFVALVPEASGFSEGEVVQGECLETQRRMTAEGVGPLVVDLMKYAKPEVENSKPLIISSPILGARLADLDQSICVSDIFTAVGFRGRNQIRPLEFGLPFGVSVKHLEIRPLSHVQRIFLDLFTEEIQNFMAEHNMYSELGVPDDYL